MSQPHTSEIAPRGRRHDLLAQRAVEHELEEWRAALDDPKFGRWRAISVAGQLFLVEHGRRWRNHIFVAWFALFSPFLIISMLLLLTGDVGIFFGSLITMGIFVAEGVGFVVCSLLWPKLVSSSSNLKRLPHPDELPMRRAALELIQQRQYNSKLSLKNAILRGFGPGVVSIAPLSFIACLIWWISFLLQSSQGSLIVNLMILAFSSVFLFVSFFFFGVVLFSATGLLAWSGKAILDDRESVRVKRLLEGSDAIGQLQLAEAGADQDGLGALTLAQDEGQLSLVEQPAHAEERGH